MVILFVTLSIKIIIAIVFGNIVDSDPTYDGFIFIIYPFSSAESTLQSNEKSGSSAEGKGLCGFTCSYSYGCLENPDQGCIFINVFKRNIQTFIKRSDLSVMMQYFLENEKPGSAALPLMPLNNLLVSSSSFGLMGGEITSSVVIGIVRVKYCFCRTTAESQPLILNRPVE